MSDERHNGTGRHCFECAFGGLYKHGFECCEVEYIVSASHAACRRFTPSIEAQRLEQMRIGNELMGCVVGAIQQPDRCDWTAWAGDLLKSIRGQKCKP